MSSREAALERRRALTTAGKKAESRYTSTPGRVRTVADARPTRTESPPPSPPPRSAEPVSERRVETATAPPRLSSLSGNGHRADIKPIRNPSRELVLARREALSRRGKRADTSRDRTRSSSNRPTPEPPAAAPGRRSDSGCGCRQARSGDAAPTSSGLGSSLGGRTSASERSPRLKRSAQHNPGRALVLARREALSRRGKAATTPTNTPAAVARQGNPDISTRELAQKLRELKSKVGSAGCARNGGCRPTGPRRGNNRLQAEGAADAHWKVGASETSTGQVVTGTQANRSPQTTGNEASTCRPITGTEYLGAEIFRQFCQSEPPSTPPGKVRVTATSHGNRITGNEVGRSEKVTGDEPGTCKNVTGTEYIASDQRAAWCGVSDASAPPRKVGLTRTESGQPVTGVLVGRSGRVTGDEPGAARNLTGDQYVGEENRIAGRTPVKVSTLQTLRGSPVTGTHVGRSERVTGDEPGSCRTITGDEYIGSQQYEKFCGQRPLPEAAKVGFSVTNKRQVVSGTRTGRSPRVTGDEPGTCKPVTGTPYAGLDEAAGWCPTPQVREIRERTPARLGTPGPRMSGIQPGIGGVMTGDERGACETVTGTPYVGEDQMVEACGAARSEDADYPQSLSPRPWEQFSVQSPARAAQVSRQRERGVTGNRYEDGSRITGPFDLGGDRITGTEQFRFDRRRSALRVPAPEAPVPQPEEAQRPTSRITGEGLSAGLRITGDDWDRGERVTGTEGASARRRNPSRPGPMSAMPAFQPKRNEALPEPVSRVTGSSGNTDRGSLITVSGGARG